MIASINQVTWDDTLNSLDRNDNQEYNTYDVTSQPSFLTGQNTTCFHTNSSSPCTIGIQLQVSPDTLLGELRQSGHGIDRTQIFIDEGGIIGGVAFFAFFLGIYVLNEPKSQETETQGPQTQGTETQAPQTQGHESSHNEV